MTMKTRQLKPMGCSKSSSKREFYSNTILPQETRKTQNRQPKFTPKTTGKRRTKDTQNQQKERNQRSEQKRSETNNSKDYEN